MSWESPITLKKYEVQPITFDRESPEETFRKVKEFVKKAAKEMADARDDYIVTKVRATMDIDIDKYELAKALKYDRDQYNKGYQDAKAEIVHCKDCFYGTEQVYEDGFDYSCAISDHIRGGNYYCASGRPK